MHTQHTSSRTLALPTHRNRLDRLEYYNVFLHRLWKYFFSLFCIFHFRLRCHRTPLRSPFRRLEFYSISSVSINCAYGRINLNGELTYSIQWFPRVPISEHTLAPHTPHTWQLLATRLRHTFLRATLPHENTKCTRRIACRVFSFCT